MLKFSKMNTPGIPRMSLEAQFDDICRYSSVLQEGDEDSFIAFVAKVQSVLLKSNDMQNEVQALRKQVSNCQAENKVLETKLKHVRSVCELEIKKRLLIKSERDALERQIAIIREVLLTDQYAMNDQTKEKLAFLSTTNIAEKHHDSPKSRLTTIDESVGSLLSSSDVSFDKTEEDMEGDVAVRGRRSGGKRRSGQGRIRGGNSPSRKRKSQEKIDDTIPKRIDVLSEYRGDNYNYQETVPALNTRSRRSNSEPTPLENRPPTPPRGMCRSDSDQLEDYPNVRNREGFLAKHATLDNPNTRCYSGSTPLRHFSSGGKLKTRNHAFSLKTLIKPEKCLPCGRGIKFYKQAYKCQDCRATCHPECKEKVPLPCVPTTHTPTNKGAMACISDYTPRIAPMIPALIIHCVNEIEQRGMTTLGLYRISGSEREVKELKERFLKGKGAPSLSKIDIHAVCGIIKDFLRFLQEPLIPRSLWKDFVNAAEMQDEDYRFSATYQAISQMPQPNRDTLAFLMLHLQRVAESPECQMPFDNIARVLGPTIVGYSSADPADGNLYTETSYQFKVMKLLLRISYDYWNNFVSVEMENVFPPISQTPETYSTPDGSSIQGSVSSSGGREPWSLRNRNGALGKTPLTPRNSRTGTTKTTRRQFFTSPLRK